MAKSLSFLFLFLFLFFFFPKNLIRGIHEGFWQATLDKTGRNPCQVSFLKKNLKYIHEIACIFQHHVHTHVGWHTTSTIPGAGQPWRWESLSENRLQRSHPKLDQFKFNLKLIQNNFERLSILNSLGLLYQV